MTDVGTCRSCGEYIGWVKTQAGNNILVDADSFLVLIFYLGPDHNVGIQLRVHLAMRHATTESRYFREGRHRKRHWINASEMSGSPSILNMSGVTAITYQNGGNPSFADIVALESNLESDNAASVISRLSEYYHLTDRS